LLPEVVDMLTDGVEEPKIAVTTGAVLKWGTGEGELVGELVGRLEGKLVGEPGRDKADGDCGDPSPYS
jgi:hypothetical protein